MKIVDFKNWILYEKGYSVNTYKSYFHDLIKFFNYLMLINEINIISMHDIQRVKRQDIRGFFLKCENSPRSNKRFISTTRTFFNFLYKKFEIDVSLIMHSIKLSKTLPKPITEEDIQKILNYFDESFAGFRNKVIFTCLYSTGMRISELLSLSFYDLLYMHKKSEVKIVGKGGYERVIPILDYLKDLLMKYGDFLIKTFKVELASEKYIDFIQFMNSSAYKSIQNYKIFLTLKAKPLTPRVAQSILQKVRMDLNLDDRYTPHGFRHSFASHLVSNGAEIRYVQEIMGHKSAATTELYTKIDTKKLLLDYKKFKP